MKFKQKPNGDYIVKYEKRIPGTNKRWSKHISKNIKTVPQAERAYFRLVAEAAVAIKGQSHLKRSIDLVEAVELFKQDCSERYAVRTMESMCTTLLKYIHSDFSDRNIHTIIGSDFRSLMKGSAKDLSSHHRKNIAKYFRALFSYLIEEGRIERNPVPKFNEKHITKLKHVFTEAEIDKLLSLAKATESPWYEIWAFAIFTGMRNGELYALTWDNVDEKKRLIKVARNWDPRGGFRNHTKNKSQRIVEYPEKLVPVIERLRAQEYDPEFVLPRAPGWSKGAQAEHLAAFLAGAGLPRIRFHDLRATWCTYLLGKGVPLAWVMKMGGWSNLKTVQFYLDSSGYDIRGASSAFDLK